MVSGEETKSEPAAPGLIFSLSLCTIWFNTSCISSSGLAVLRMCLTHPRLNARRIIRIVTPADQMVSIIGIRTSSQAEILAVRLSGS